MLMLQVGGISGPGQHVFGVDRRPVVSATAAAPRAGPGVAGGPRLQVAAACSKAPPGRARRPAAAAPMAGAAGKPPRSCRSSPARREPPRPTCPVRRCSSSCAGRWPTSPRIARRGFNYVRALMRARQLPDALEAGAGLARDRRLQPGGRPADRRHSTASSATRPRAPRVLGGGRAPAQGRHRPARAGPACSKQAGDSTAPTIGLAAAAELSPKESAARVRSARTSPPARPRRRGQAAVPGDRRRSELRRRRSSYPATQRLAQASIRQLAREATAGAAPAGQAQRARGRDSPGSTWRAAPRTTSRST